MQKKEYIDVFEQRTPASQWEIPVNFGMLFPEVDSLFELNRTYMNADYQVILQDDKMVINFGLEEHSGYAKFSWVEYTQGDSCSPQGITVNIDNATDGLGDTKTKAFLENTLIPITVSTTDSAILYYRVINTTGKIETGMIMIVNDSNLGLNAERHANEALLPLEFSVSKNEQNLYLGITAQDQETYTFSYKLITF